MDTKKQKFKIVASWKSTGKIHEFVLTSDFTNEMALDFARNHFPFTYWDVLAVCPVDPSAPRLAAYIVTFENKKDTLVCSYRVIAENGIKAIDLAIKEFENDYHHRDIDVVGLVRSKGL